MMLKGLGRSHLSLSYLLQHDECLAAVDKRGSARKKATPIRNAWHPVRSKQSTEGHGMRNQTCTQSVWLMSISPMSRIVLPQFWTSIVQISRQKSGSLSKSVPIYSAPQCSMVKKHIFWGARVDGRTSFRIPISPIGRVFSWLPLRRDQDGGQLWAP